MTNKYKGKRVAAYSGSRNLYPMMVPAVKSLLVNSDVEEIWLYIEDDEFPREYEMPEDLVKIRNCSDQRYFRFDGPNMKSNYTYLALMRSTYAKEFPELDRILSLDVDTIVIDDISLLWDLPLDDNGGYYFSASPEPYGTQQARFDYLYTNIGVCMYNLKKLRDGKVDEVIKALNETRYSWMEQDCFNEKCAGRVYPMEPEYNFCRYTIRGQGLEAAKIIHFSGDKKWSDKPIVEKYGAMDWKYIRKLRAWHYGL